MTPLGQERLPKRLRQPIALNGDDSFLVSPSLRAWPRHGRGIGLAIRASSNDALQIEHGSIYPALHRLESRGWLAAEWKTSEASRRAKYYTLTRLGKKQLSEEQSKWKQLVRLIARTTKPIQG